MIELILSIVLIVSLSVVLLILARKVPVLNTLPQNGNSGIKKHQIILDAESKIKEILISFEKQILLHKFLSWVKVMTMKVEIITDRLLHSIRRKAQKIDKDLNEKK